MSDLDKLPPEVRGEITLGQAREHVENMARVAVEMGSDAVKMGGEKSIRVYQDVEVHANFEFSKQQPLQFVSLRDFSELEIKYEDLKAKYADRGLAMQKTGEVVRSLYAGSEVSKRILALREENETLWINWQNSQEVIEFWKQKANANQV